MDTTIQPARLPNRVRTIQANVRLDTSERQNLVRFAKANNMTLAGAMRYLIASAPQSVPANVPVTDAAQGGR